MTFYSLLNTTSVVDGLAAPSYNDDAMVVVIIISSSSILQTRREQEGLGESVRTVVTLQTQLPPQTPGF